MYQSKFNGFRAETEKQNMMKSPCEDIMRKWSSAVKRRRTQETPNIILVFELWEIKNPESLLYSHGT